MIKLHSNKTEEIVFLRINSHVRASTRVINRTDSRI